MQYTEQIAFIRRTATYMDVTGDNTDLVLGWMLDGSTEGSMKQALLDVLHERADAEYQEGLERDRQAQYDAWDEEEAQGWADYHMI